MRVLNIHGPGDVRLDAVDPPRPGSTDAVVKVKACGVCGSDLSYIKLGGLRADGVTPLGHEAAGEVIAVGGDVSDVAVGERVVINPMQTPGFIGNGGPDGAFTEELLVRDAEMGKSLLPIPAELPYEVAALCEPLAVAKHGVNRLEVRPGDKVAVFGCGPIGLGMVMWLVDSGITEVVALDLAPERLGRATALGAAAVVNPAEEDVRTRLLDVHGSEVGLLGEAVATDGFLDAAGAPNILSDVVRMAKPHARMVVTAVYMDPVPLDLASMLSNEMSITTAMGYPTEMPEVLAALPRLSERATGIISHRIPFDRILDALDVAGTATSAKVMVGFE